MSLANISAIEQYVIDMVKKKRAEKGMSQKELAFLLNKAISFVGSVESPKFRHAYNLEHINELAKIFECSPKDFLPEKPL